MTNVLPRRAFAAATLLPAALLASRAEAVDAGPESTFARVQRTKTIRVAALPGELPWFAKDLASGEWSGAAIEMARDIAKVFDAKLEYVESTYGNSVLDLQSNKIDLAFALNPTPARALAVRFTHPVINHPFGCLARKDLAPKTWADINKPELKIAVDLGSTHETVARRFAPKAQILGFRNRDEAMLALQSGRADVDILAVLLGVTALVKNPSLGPYHLLSDPAVALPSNCAVQREEDTRFVEVVDAYIEFNRAIGATREYVFNGLTKMGVNLDDLPPNLVL
jgi:polar amino acid transport system substrate-binding protein